MAIALTHADFTELSVLAEQQGESIVQQTGFGTQYNLPRKLGEGGEQTFELRHSLRVRLRNCKLRQTIRFENPHDSAMPLVAKFHLSGNSRVLTPDVPGIDPIIEKLQDSTIYTIYPIWWNLRSGTHKSPFRW